MNIYATGEFDRQNAAEHLIRRTPTSLLVGFATLIFLIVAEQLDHWMDFVIGDFASMCVRLILVSLVATAVTYLVFGKKERLFGRIYKENLEGKDVERLLREQSAQLTNAQRLGRMGSWSVDLRNGSVVWSQATCEIFGVDADKFDGRFESLRGFILDEDLPAYDAAAIPKSPDDPVFQAEYRICRTDGEIRWMYSRGTFAFDNEGHAVSRVGMVMDITEKKAVEHELVNSREHLSLAQDVAKMGSFELDLKTFVAVSSPALVALYGAESGLGDSKYEEWVKLVHPADVPATEVNMQNAISTGELSSEYRIIRPDGEIRWLWAKGKVIYDDAGAPAQLVGVNMDITESKNAADALQVSEQRYRDLIENAHDIIFTLDLGGMFTSVNKACEEITGFSKSESVTMTIEEVVAPEFHKKVREMLAKKLAGEFVTAYGIEILRKDKTRVAVEINSRIIKVNDLPVGVEGIARDVTERRKLEEQLHQSQKLESVGLLAGGIAHDFNNMLTAINGYSDLTLRKLQKDDPLRRNIEEIKKAGVRSAELTSQLLAFSRKQIQQTEVLNFNAIVTDLENMLRPLIGENIKLETHLAPDLGNVGADPGQVEQVLLNLAVNARDAMPTGGTLSITTENVFLDEDYVSRHIGAQCGDYVMLAVSDTGTGIDEEQLEHIFEPFYTTKEFGKGTGLGLATVYGIVKQSSGHIWFESEVGVGSTFNIYLPRIKASAARDPKAESRGPETILIVEDEELVRNLGAQILESRGYNVLKASDGAEALTVIENEPLIDLLITDVMMPNMSGPQLSEKAALIRPSLKMLFMSGYTDDALFRQGIKEKDGNFIQKPFSYDTLIRKVRARLDSKF